MLPTIRRSMIAAFGAFVLFMLAYFALERTADPIAPFDDIGRIYPQVGIALGMTLIQCQRPLVVQNRASKILRPKISIPEIINRKDALFEPRQPGDIASRIAEVLSNVEFRQNLKAWGFQRAKAFTWEASARKALDAFETLHAERQLGCIFVPDFRDGSTASPRAGVAISPTPPGLCECCEFQTDAP